MNTKSASLVLATAISFAGFAMAQDTTNATAATTGSDSAAQTSTSTPAAAMSELDVRNTLKAQGYTHIHEVKYSGGTWVADAKSADGNRVEVRVDAATGKVIPDETVATIDKDAIIAKLLAANYSDVHDVEFDDGVWNAEAKDSSGYDVDLKLDPNTGNILGVDREDAEEHH